MKKNGKKKQVALQCSECKYWFGHGDGYGECFRHAPRPVLITQTNKDSDTTVIWPTTEDVEFCGEWKH